MKQLKFDHQYASDIVGGVRTSTIRIDDKGISVGDRLQVVDKTSSSNPQSWEIPGEIFVDGVAEYRLKKLPKDLAEQAELGTEPDLATYDFLTRFYGDKINDDTPVKVISFTYEPYEQPVPYMLKVSAGTEDDLRKVKLFADGGSRGNPGPSAYGFVILDGDTDELLESRNKYLGITTNNQAEYHGLLSGLEWCKQHNVQHVEVYLDSLLVVNQMNGIYKVKNRDLWAIYEAAKRVQGSFKSIQFIHVPRELNKLADAEVNKALDAVKGDELVQ
jgi:ribonuclease HI